MKVRIIQASHPILKSLLFEILIISLISALNLTACGKVNEIDRHPVDVVVDTGTSSDKDAAVVVSVGTKMIDDTKQ